ncbi:GNAT family N-acetyltransferase [Heyndrickxia sp. MSNUG]|uniref:GNAT family N-acetyltransferase n=1 Tax=Heyndrickxia sp. MSNUG TaxID=3136677 RepID=UPI003C2E8208
MVNIVSVTQGEEDTLHHLMQFYIYEFTVFQDIKIERNGKYTPFDLMPYWTEPNLHAFFIVHENELAGFSLVESGSEDQPHIIREFFILRKFYRRGFGKAAAVKLFDMFQGKWSITQIEKNEPAKAFWRKIIREYTGGNYTERSDNRKRSIQEFDTALILK